MILGKILTVDMYEGVATHVSHTGTAKHLTLRGFKGALGIVLYGTDVTRQHGDFRAAVHITLVTATIYVTTNLDLPKDIEH